MTVDRVDDWKLGDLAKGDIMEHTKTIQIRKNGKPTNETFTIITDVETDGRLFYEELMNAEHANHLVLCWNEYDDLLEALEALYNDCRNVPMDEQRNEVMQKASDEIAKAKE
ncbi:hypothetical protein LCGC14_0375970 [marine sediment metagenome]|uniref:Uncharacterized protein n=1 Tax=marine sediment metagenome TaxID=412755 RepID=A0A0F9T9N5_9ZZZZ